MAEVNYKVKLHNYTFSLVSVWLGPTPHIEMHAHSNLSYELHYIESGHGILRLDDREYTLGPGMLYLTGPGIDHEQIPVSPEWAVELGLYYTVSLPIKRKNKDVSLKSADWVTSLLDQHFWIGDASTETVRLLHSVYEEVTLQKGGYQENIPFLTGSLLIALNRLYSQQNIPSTKIFIPRSEDEKYLQIERSLLASAGTIGLSALAGEVGLSVRQLQRLIKSHYGTTFKKIQTDYKLKIALRLLKETEETVADIAEAAGFSSADYFGYCFRQKYHVSPTQYRQNQTEA